jgi:hypothetical protein
MTSSLRWSYTFSQHREEQAKTGSLLNFVGLQYHDSLRVMISAGMTLVNSRRRRYQVSSLARLAVLRSNVDH